jgi:hypothetical protein
MEEYFIVNYISETYYSYQIPIRSNTRDVSILLNKLQEQFEVRKNTYMNTHGLTSAVKVLPRNELIITENVFTVKYLNLEILYQMQFVNDT